MVTRDQRGPGFGAKVGRGFEQRAVQALQRRVKRQDRERQITVDQPEDHGAVVIEQGQGRVDEAELLEQSVEQTGVAQQEHPGVSPNQKAGPKGQHHQSEIEILRPAGARDKQREREAQQQTERGGRAGDPKRSPENFEIEGIDEALIAFERPGRCDAAVDAAREKAISRG